MINVALFVGGQRDGARVDVPVHNQYFVSHVLPQLMNPFKPDTGPPQPIPYTTERYVQTGVRVSEFGDTRVYVHEPLLSEHPQKHATEIAFALLIEGYRNPRCI
jgi:hypothetical protein